MQVTMPKQQKLLAMLIDAIIDNDVALVNELLNEGVDPNSSLDAARVTPLHFAAQSDSLEVIPLLIEAGADLYAVTQPDGQSPLEVAVLHNHQRVVHVLIAYMNETDFRQQ